MKTAPAFFLLLLLAAACNNNAPSQPAPPADGTQAADTTLAPLPDTTRADTVTIVPAAAQQTPAKPALHASPAQKKATPKKQAPLDRRGVKELADSTRG